MSIQELNEINAQIKNLKERRKQLFTRSVLWEVAGPVLAFPAIENVSFATYVPSFNDGDPCEFSLTEPVVNYDVDEDYDGEEGLYIYTIKGEIEFALGKVDPKPSYYDQPRWDAWVAERASDGQRWLDAGWTLETVNELDVKMKQFAKFIYDNQETIEEVYGWPYRFIITAEGLEQEDYDCGY